MTTFVKIDIEGLDALRMAFDELPEQAMPKVYAAAIEGAEMVIRRAKSHINHRTGTLARNLIVKKPPKRGKNRWKVEARATFTKEAAYAVPLELGHGIIVVRQGKRRGVGVVPEKPFLRPAADESRAGVRYIVEKAVDKALGEMGGMQ